jgi:hypothetical protein
LKFLPLLPAFQADDAATNTAARISTARWCSCCCTACRTVARNLITAARSPLGKLVSFAIARVLMIFFIGFVVGMAWEAARRERRSPAGPHLARLAPAVGPGVTPYRFKAMSLALATTRQSLDKLANEISKVQAQDGTAPRRRAGH